MTQIPESSSSAVHTIRLSDSAVDRLLDRLDAEDSAASTETPDGKMFPYRVRKLRVCLEQPGGTVAQFEMISRALGVQEIVLLHGGFVYLGTRCLVLLAPLYGARAHHSGVTKTCRHVHGNIHELVIQFQRQIDVAQFCRAAVGPRVLLVEDEAISANVASFHLTELNARVDHVQDGAQAVEKALSAEYDLVLMDMDMPVMDGFTAAKTLRDRGYSGMIVAVTALPQEGIAEKCTEHGCDRYLSKPYKCDDLAQLIDALVEDPLYSSLGDREGMVPVINAFVEQLPARVRALDKACVDANIQQIESLARTLKSEAGALGFEPITLAAAELEGSILGGAAIEALHDQIVQVTNLCRSARPTR